MKTALSIAGSDPTGGAGFQADLKVFQSLGVYGLSAPTALTAQNTTGITRILPVENGFFKEQLDYLLADIRPDAYKTGMLYSVDAVTIVAEMHERHGLLNLVIDPVTVSSTGAPLVQEGTLSAIRQTLFPLATVITPNIYEAELLCGIKIEGVSEMQEAARALHAMGPKTVVVTGGHLAGCTVDIFFDGKDVTRFERAKLDGEYHGTGCAFSAALTAGLSVGISPAEAASRAKEFVYEAIKNAIAPGKGLRLLGL